MLLKASKSPCLHGVSKHCQGASASPIRPVQQRAVVVVYAKKKDGDLDISAAGDMLNSAVDSLANFVPESVPRPAAKTGVAVVGGLILFGLVQKVISGIFTLALLGGVGWYLLTRDSSSSDDSGMAKKSSSSKPVAMDDPLADAKRIMDKYK